jgi:tetratricopeptide (TPR) repeat protein
LRTVVLVLLAITTCLVIATGSYAVYDNHFRLIWENEARVEEIDSLWDDFGEAKSLLDVVEMRRILAELDEKVPNSAEVQQSLAEVDRIQWCSELYSEAVSLDRRGDWEGAMDLGYQVPQDCHNYDDVQAFINSLRKQGELKNAWAEALALRDADDCPGVIDTLTWLREENPEFERVQVEDLLFECHVRIARQLLDAARGDVGMVREAVDHLKAALTLKPANREMVDEYRLAVGYVAGHEAYDRGDWSVAVVRWEPLWVMQPDYQGGALEDKLFECYPLAAKQLISEAQGSTRLLKQAIDHLGQALLYDPGNEELEEERTFAEEYVTGLEAFVQEDWDLAIVHWGPIRIARPDYQNGVLRDNLRQACTQSTAPDEEYCRP